MSEYQKALDHGCGDHSCYFAKPKGMGTNGGCRCLPTRSAMKWITESFEILAGKDQRISQLEDALRDMAETVRWYSNGAVMLDYAYNSSGDPLGYLCEEDFEQNEPHQSHYGRRARKTLQNYKDLLSKINEEKK